METARRVRCVGGAALWTAQENQWRHIPLTLPYHWCGAELVYTGVQCAHSVMIPPRLPMRSDYRISFGGRRYMKHNNVIIRFEAIHDIIC